VNDVKADAKAIFLQALDRQAPDELHRFLDDACGDDTALRARAEELLRAHRDAGNFLGGLQLLDAAQDEPLAERPGTVVGPYKLLEQIGEGGMGLVFMAEQTRPVKRRVALKVLKPGMDTRQVVARFEAERQALALMDHPNIARIHDGGTTESGRPFFVMELVRGVPITDFCDERKLTTRQRLELFVQVCAAVQHAHQKGVIHRDLKPSNVLVTLHDSLAVPKVIDFGIAKATAGPLTDRTLFTHFAQVVGTPLYMSPEQAEMNGLDVDTRSDVYSLGVLLYELLTGTTPFEPEALRKAGLDEVRRIIREEEPPAPSQRLNTLDAQSASTVSARRGVDGRRLGQLLRGELDWVVMKCLEKDRDRRYESASAVAADVQRYLADEPVAAGPPSAWYRARKYWRRNRRALVTAGTFAAVLVTATAVSAWQAVVARAAQHQAEVDRERANQEAAIAQAVNNFLQDDLLRQVNSDPTDEFGLKGNSNLTVREALDRAAAKVGERFRDQPLVEAAIRMAIGEAYCSVDERRLESKHLERALELRKVHLGSDHPETLRVMHHLAHAYTAIGRYSEAIALREQLLENAKSRHGPNSPETLQQLAELAVAHRRAGNWQRAMRIMGQVVEQEQSKGGPIDSGVLAHAHLLGMLHMDAGNYLEAADRIEKVIALRRTLPGPDDDLVMKTCALAYQRAGKLDEADRILRALLERNRKRNSEMGQLRLFPTLELLSTNLLLQNRLTEAELLAREGLAICENIRGTELEWRGPHLRSVLGGILLGQKKYAEAEPLLVQGYEGMKLGEWALIGSWRFRLTEAGERVVRYYEETNQPAKAREWREKLKANERGTASHGIKSDR
jgi:serine/threonine protein kinase/tetratricopeptide (TPR) repeat protein